MESQYTKYMCISAQSKAEILDLNELRAAGDVHHFSSSPGCRQEGTFLTWKVYSFVSREGMTEMREQRLNNKECGCKNNNGVR